MQHRIGQSGHDAVQFARTRGETMVGGRTDERRRRLDRIDAAHLRAHRIAPRCKIPRETHVARRRAQQVAVDRHDHIGFVEPRCERQRPAVSADRCLAHGIARQRLPLVPSHGRITLLQRRELACE